MSKYKFILKIATWNIDCLSDYFCGGHKLNYDYNFVAPLRKTRDASRQLKSTEKCSERYLMFGPNHILITFVCDDGRSPGWKMSLGGS